MSKVFEALQRLERDSGKLPPGVLLEAQQIFENGGPAPGSNNSVEIAPELPDEPNLMAEPAFMTDPPQRHAESAGRSFDLSQVAEARAEAPGRSFDLGQVAVENATISPDSRIVYFSDPDSPGADRFRLLRMRLWPLWESGKLKTLLITSPQPQDGKSTVVLNLATALAEQGQRKVLVIEGDLSRPSLSLHLGLPNREGLGECLEAGRDPLSLLRRIEPLGWYLLSAGDVRGNPAELLQSPVLPEIFDTLTRHFDWVIVDSPPVIPLTDTLSLKHQVDAGLLVVRADRTPRTMVENAVARIGSKHLLGLVFNSSEELGRAYSDYRKHYDPAKRRK
jgi:capsular exopolysaccharide synthesis family protein